MHRWKRKTGAGIASAVILVLFSGFANAASPGAEWSGTIASAAGDDLALVGVADRFRLAGSATELFSGRTLAIQDLAPGSAVTLRIGEREADGRLRVDRLVVEPKNPLVLTGPINRVADDRRSMEILGVAVAFDGQTAFSGRSASGPVRAARDLRVGMTVRVALVPVAGGILTAGAVSLASLTSEPGEDQEFRGTVVSISETSWTIGDRVFLIDSGTIFRRDPSVGNFVEVKFHLDADGNAVADRIQREDDDDEPEVEFLGIVEAIGDTSWTISGRVVVVNASTQILRNPGLGDTVEVEALRADDGTLTARKIQREDAGDDEVEFRGIVEAVGETAWQIAGRDVLVNSTTAFRGNPGLGDLVEVRAERDAQGLLTATDIKLEDAAGGDDDGDDDHGDDNSDNDNSGHGDGDDDGDNSGHGGGHGGPGDGDPSGDD